MQPFMRHAPVQHSQYRTVPLAMQPWSAKQLQQTPPLARGQPQEFRRALLRQSWYGYSGALAMDCNCIPLLDSPQHLRHLWRQDNAMQAARRISSLYRMHRQVQSS